MPAAAIAARSCCSEARTSGTPQEQFRRATPREATRRTPLGIHLAAHDPPVGIFAHEQRNAVFHDLDLAFEVGDQRRRRGVLHFRLLEDRFRGEAALETQLRLVSALLRVMSVRRTMESSLSSAINRK